jgi:lysophospholipase L1-like esterase
MGWTRRGRRVWWVAPAVLVAGATGGLALAPVAPPAAASPPSYDVALGDSYAAGFQPVPALSYLHGYTRTVVTLERRRGRDLSLENFGCSGATTTSLLSSIGCPAAARAHDGAPYTTIPQAEAARDFIAAHRGHIALVTLSIGGNDVIDDCRTAASPFTCITGVLPTVAKNITTVVSSLRAAAGNGVPVVGLTYPDVLLGEWVRPPVNKTQAGQSILAFDLFVNPALKRAYDGAGATFVDVTRASGAYIPLHQTVTVAPYGTIPEAVARTCSLTWYCALGDIHPRTRGYALICSLIVASLPRKLQ